MKLLMTADTVGGVWTYASDLGAGLAERGIEVTLAVLGPTPAEIAPVSGVEIMVTGLPLDWTATGAAELSVAAKGFSRLARELGADLVHLNSPALAAFAEFEAPVVGGCHSCLATWWAAVRGGDPPADFAWRIDATARGYAACNTLIAPTAAFSDATFQAYGVRPSVVRNGRRAMAAGRGGERTRSVASAGRFWDEAKGAATLDAMAARLDAPVLALGPCVGPQGEEIVFSHVCGLGRVSASRVASTLRQAAVFVSTALYEPFGLAVLEAAQAGCALVLSDLASFRELWDGVAVFVAPRDADGFAAAARRLLDDPAEAARRGAAACTRASRYGLDALVEGVSNVHRATLQTGRTRTAAIA